MTITTLGNKTNSSASWKRCLLGEVLTLQRGFDLPHRLRRDGKTPIVTSSGVSDTHNKAMVAGPGVVTGRYGTIGEVFYVEEDFWPLNTTLFVRDFKGNDPLFISYLLRTIDFKSHSGKSGVPGVNRNDLHGLLVSIPDLEEQKLIAQALADADALLMAQDQLIAKKRDIKKGAMQELLTGKRRLPGFSSAWQKKTLYELAGKRKDLFDDGDWIEARYLSETGVRLIQTGNIGVGCFIDKSEKKFISEESFSTLRCKELQVGDVLICRLAEPAGRACIFPGSNSVKTITAVDVTIFRPQEDLADRRYLVQVFNTKDWFESVAERCGGSTRSRIARGALGKMEIEIPSVVEQHEIANILEDMDKEIAVLEAQREKAAALKQGMMQQLLTGKIRLT